MFKLAAVMCALSLLTSISAVEAPPLETTTGETQSEQVTAPSTAITSAKEVVNAEGKDPSGQPPITPTAQSGDMTLSVTGGGAKGTSTAVTLLLIITALSIAPAFLMMMTSFTRIIIVLGFVRRALGTQTLPPNQVVLGLALFLTLFVMAPTLKEINDKALQPYLAETMPQAQALDQAKQTVRNFMLKHTRKADLALFIKLAREERPQTVDDVSFTTLMPAFMTSELKTSFQMGFIIFLPFLVIDLVISAVLMALGMMMLPPVVVSLPFKILLFVLVDGWVLLMQGLVTSYA